MIEYYVHVAVFMALIGGVIQQDLKCGNTVGEIVFNHFFVLLTLTVTVIGCFI